jgi:predicted nucleic-acid-binding Zn-ribbon protein
MDNMENQPLLDTSVVEQNGSKKKIAVAGVLAAGLLFGGAVVSNTGSVAPHTSLDESTTVKDKVELYIIAEAFCPNCKEHSYLLDTLVMDKGDDLRSILDLKLDMMVYDGWDEATDTGECEKGAWDCEYSKYHLAVQKIYADDATLSWWDYSRCLYKSQDKMLAKYVEEGRSNAYYMKSVVGECASSTGLDADLIQDMVTENGQHLLKESYGRTIEYSMPVWIYVNGNYIEYEDDWINAVCAAYADSESIGVCSQTSSLDGGNVAEKSSSLFDDNGKVDVYIVAEAFCPNCREHSYYFDELVMSPEGSKSGVRKHLNVMMEQMVIDGWNEETDEGMCEKGKFDCELSKYHLCAQKLERESTDTTEKEEVRWWDYSRCLYEHQTEMIDYYYTEGGQDMSLMTAVTTECADKANIVSADVDTCVSSEGTSLLKESYLRIGKMNDPVWIYVEGQRIDYHEDWLSTVCAAMKGKGREAEECVFDADVRKK